MSLVAWAIRTARVKNPAFIHDFKVVSSYIFTVIHHDSITFPNKLYLTSLFIYYGICGIFLCSNSKVMVFKAQSYFHGNSFLPSAGFLVILKTIS